MVKRILGASLIAFCLSGVTYAQNLVTVPMHYSLAGSAGNLQVEISLDTYVERWPEFAVHDSPYDIHKMVKSAPAGFFTLITSPLRIELKNRGPDNIDLNNAIDKLILSDGDSQIEFNLLAIPDYPRVLLRNSTVRLTLPSPIEFGTLYTELAYDSLGERSKFMIKLMATAMSADMMVQEVASKDKLTVDSAISKVMDQFQRPGMVWGDFIVGINQTDVQLKLNLNRK